MSDEQLPFDEFELEQGEIAPDDFSPDEAETSIDTALATVNTSLMYSPVEQEWMSQFAGAQDARELAQRLMVLWPNAKTIADYYRNHPAYAWEALKMISNLAIRTLLNPLMGELWLIPSSKGCSISVGYKGFDKRFREQYNALEASIEYPPVTEADRIAANAKEGDVLAVCKVTVAPPPELHQEQLTKYLKIAKQAGLDGMDALNAANMMVPYKPSTYVGYGHMRVAAQDDKKALFGWSNWATMQARKNALRQFVRIDRIPANVETNPDYRYQYRLQREDEIRVIEGREVNDEDRAEIEAAREQETEEVKERLAPKDKRRL